MVRGGDGLHEEEGEVGEERNTKGPARDCWDIVVEGEQEGGHNGEGREVGVTRAAVREGKQGFGEEAGTGSHGGTLK